MLGYAREPADLTLGRTVMELRTGDLGRRAPDGLFEVVARSNRFIKPYGIRIDLDDTERLLAAEGCTAACTGTDTELVATVEADPHPAAVRTLLADRTGLPAHAIRVVTVPALPRRPTGKIDYASMAAVHPRWTPPRRRCGPRSVRDATETWT